jgi:hypothetical protein
VHFKVKKESTSGKRKKEPEDFFAFVPNQIEAEDGYDSRLEGFPLNILYGGIKNDAQTGQQSLVDVCYEPAPETFHEDSERKEMCYFSKLAKSSSRRTVVDGRRKSIKAIGSSAARSVRRSTRR